jgi:hypothetical protein
MRPQFFHIRFGVFAPHNSLLLCFLSHSVLLIREGALLTLCYNLAMDEMHHISDRADFIIRILGGADGVVLHLQAGMLPS